jgi:hypothetical protein
VLETVRAHGNVKQLGGKWKLSHVAAYERRSPLNEHAGALEHPKAEIKGEEAHSRIGSRYVSVKECPRTRAGIERPVIFNREEPSAAELLEKVTVRVWVAGHACKGVPEPALALERRGYFCSAPCARALSGDHQITGLMAQAAIVFRHISTSRFAICRARGSGNSQRIRLNTNP